MLRLPKKWADDIQHTTLNVYNCVFTVRCYIKCCTHFISFYRDALACVCVCSAQCSISNAASIGAVSLSLSPRVRMSVCFTRAWIESALSVYRCRMLSHTLTHLLQLTHSFVHKIRPKNKSHNHRRCRRRHFTCCRRCFPSLSFSFCV